MIRKATTRDVRDIYHLIKFFADKELMLKRPTFEIYENIRNFWVVEDNSEVVACCALELYWEGLGEVKSLAVRADRQKQGLGRLVVEACIEDGRVLGLETLFALTYQDGFFRKLGFRDIDKSNLPQKIWAECVNCKKFPNCNEKCLIIELN